MTAEPDDLAFLGAAALARLVAEKRVSAVELARLYLARIERFDARLRAYITVLPDAALEAARRADG
ncbi:MAG TPA: amidase, partial [Methylomirabilota bacterium]|nr:amidase [Methylomirabilota bacterium]